MKNYLSALFIFAASCPCFGQFGDQQIISTSQNLPIRSIPVDLDKDGFIDVLAASAIDGKISWYKNTDGEGGFSTETIISTSVVSILDLQLADFDNDNDLDVLYKTNVFDKIAWIENLDGMGSFGEEQIISTVSFPYVIRTGDVDNDGDLDIVARLFNDSLSELLVWYENLDGLGGFSEALLIREIPDSSYDVVLVDLDNDDDLDIVTSFWWDSELNGMYWLENMDGNFEDPQLIYQPAFLASDFTKIVSITPVDLDNDGNIDLLFDTQHDKLPENIYWIKNIDAATSFSEPSFIYSETSDVFRDIEAFDVDADGDNDIVIGSGDQNEVLWFENEDGLGQFGAKTVITTKVNRLRDISWGYIDSDEYLDLITASSFDDTIAWYKNLGLLNIPDVIFSHIIIYPNPSSGIITIDSAQKISDIELYNILGQQFFVTLNNNQLNLEMFPSGMYYLSIQTENGKKQVEKIILK
jgi:hypothetical protein